MYLFLRAQDLHELEIGLSQNGKLIFCSTHLVSPESYLSTIAKVLKNKHVSTNELTGIFVVTGPGSFTASRISITIANTLAFAKGVPVFAVKNQNFRPIEKFHDEVLSEPLQSESFVQPYYAQPPHITQPTISNGDTPHG